MPVEIQEGPHVHATLINRTAHDLAAGGHRAVDDVVDLVAAVGRQAPGDLPLVVLSMTRSFRGRGAREHANVSWVPELILDVVSARAYVALGVLV